MELYIGGRVFEWEILEYIDKNTVKCKCSCGETIKNVRINDLKAGKSKSCGKPIHRLKYKTGDKFGELTIDKYIGNNVWRCICSCGKIHDVKNSDLKSGATKSCGHLVKQYSDLSGQTFGMWDVIEYQGSGNWLCRCRCTEHNESIVTQYNLINKLSTSCGCMKKEKTYNTMMQKYGEICTNKARDAWQIEAIQSKEMLNKAIERINSSNIYVLADELGIGYCYLYRLIHKYELEEFVDINKKVSYKEEELRNEIAKVCNKKIVLNARNVIYRTELDIYIPDEGIAIEFNGNYWHSNICKDRLFHQNKTLECIKHNIRLIHIFEYEWDNEDSRRKVLQMIENILSNTSKVVYARNTIVKAISCEEANRFIDKYHISGKCSAKINIGCMCNDTIIGVLTLDKPRFDNNYEYEIIRLCWLPDVKVVGGFEKLFKMFYREYKPKSILSYADLAKFTGHVYSKVGFKLAKNGITEPNYIWYNSRTGSIVSRYSSMKSRLIEIGLGTVDMTEEQIMDSIGFIKIYDSGNAKFVWRDGEDK